MSHFLFNQKYKIKIIQKKKGFLMNKVNNYSKIVTMSMSKNYPIYYLSSLDYLSALIEADSKN